jgi:PAS domain S-box-containing protein
MMVEENKPLIDQYSELEQSLIKTKKEVEYFKNIAEATGKKYLRGIDQLSTLITECKKAEKALKESEEKYRNLIERANDVVIIVQDGIVKFVNNRVVNMFGYSVGEMVDTPFLDYVFPDERNKIKELHKQRLKGKDVPDIYEMRALHKDGKKLDVETNSGIITYQGNLAVLALIRDITDRKRMEEALYESNSKLSAMLASIGDHMSMMDEDLNIIWANEIAEKIFGKDIIGKKCYEVYHKRTEPCKPYPCIALRAFQDGKNHEHETQVVDKDGQTVFFHCTANIALKDKKGKPTAVLEISRDITEKVRVDDELQKAHDELEQRVYERTKELEIKTKNLEEINIAMKVLLKKREEDKKDIEDNVLTNIRKLIEPYFEKLRKTELDSRQKAFLNIMESNFQEITSQFTRKISLGELNLTQAEIQIANLIRQGNSSKEIAEIINISVRTVNTHRRNIRKKIGLNKKRVNLRSYLLSLS